MWPDVDFKVLVGNGLLFLVVVVVVNVCVCLDNTQIKKRKLLLHSLLHNGTGISRATKRK